METPATTLTTPSRLLRSMFDAALAAVRPDVCVAPHLPDPATVKGRIVVVGAGKAAAAMAAALETAWADHLDRVSGIVVTRYGHGVPTRKIEVIEAAHPVPDEAGLAAARRILGSVRGLSADDLVIALMSGGGSALLVMPAPGMTLAEKQAWTKELLMSGASIHEINAARKAMSAIKGGKLAAAAMPARVLTLAISDVPGDDPATIASGPTVPPTDEPVDSLLHSRCETRIIATALSSLKAAAEMARQAGVVPLILGDRIEGEAREVAKVLAGIALSCKEHALPLKPPCVILSGGETTVTVKGAGRGGRNAEFLLGLAIALQGADGIHAMACDTDGIDGSEDNAGALLLDSSLARAATVGMDARAKLAENDAYGFFAALDDLVVTGPTRTNINDFRAIYIEP